MVARMSREFRTLASPLMNTTIDNTEGGGSLYYPSAVQTASRTFSAGQPRVWGGSNPCHSLNGPVSAVPPQPPVPACRARRASRIAVMLGLEPGLPDQTVETAAGPQRRSPLPEQPHVTAAAGWLQAQPQAHLATSTPSPADDTTPYPTNLLAPAACSAAPDAIQPFSCVPLAGYPDTAFALAPATSLPSPGIQGITLQPVFFRRSSCVVYTPSDQGDAPAAPAPVEDALFDRMELEDCPLAPGCPSVSGEALLLVDGRLLAEMSAAAQGGALSDELFLDAMADGSVEGPALFSCAVTGADEATAVDALCPGCGLFEGWEEVPRLPRR